MFHKLCTHVFTNTTQVMKTPLSSVCMITPGRDTASSYTLFVQVETDATTHGSEKKFQLHGYLLTGDEERGLCLSLREKTKDKGFLVLDLDETLIDARDINDQNHIDKPKTPGLVSFKSPKYRPRNHLVYKRPGADEFLRELSQYYDISICCAGGLDYAQEMIMRAGW